MLLRKSICCALGLSLVGALQLGLSPQGRCALRAPWPAMMYYERAEGDTAEIDVQRVADLLGERQELREARDFDAADAVRDELKTGMGVTVLDREGVWFVGDRMPGSSARTGNFPPSYTRQQGDTAEVDVEKVEELVASRAVLRVSRDFEG